MEGGGVRVVKTQSGFTIVEILVVSGLLAGTLLATSKLATDIYKFQKDTVNTSEANEFSAAIGYYLNQNCREEFSGETFPLKTSENPNPPPENIALTKYGTWSNTPLPKIEKDVEFDGKWKVKKLTWEHKSSIPIQKYKRAGQDLKVAVARIVLETRVIREGTTNKSLDNYSIEIPLILDNNNNVVDCLSGSLGPTGEDICDQMGADYDLPTDMCIPRDHCFIVTQFVNCTSNKGWRSRHNPQSPCEQLILPHITENGKKQYFNFYHTDSGGALGSCPDGTEKIFTGNIAKTGSVSCGTSCTNTYAAEAKVYLCIKCQFSTN